MVDPDFGDCNADGVVGSSEGVDFPQTFLNAALVNTAVKLRLERRLAEQRSR